MLPEIDDPLAARVLDVGVANVPLLRHQPVEHRRSRGDLLERERHVLLKQAQALTDPVAGDAPADRIQRLNQPVGAASRCRRVELPDDLGDRWPLVAGYVRSGHAWSFSESVETGSGHSM